MIPKIIHYCWFGGKPLPDSAKKCIASWRKFLPDYEIKEWNESNFDVNCIKYTREAYRLKKYAFVSDYARFFILYKYGGLYFDIDVEVIRNMDDIISRGPFMGREAQPVESETEPKYNNTAVKGTNPGLGLGVAPGLDLYKNIVEWYNAHHFTTWNGKFTGTVVDIVSKILSTMPIKMFDNGVLYVGGVYIYPPEYFCPKNYFTGEIHLTDNTRCIHHYTATWVNRRTLWQKIKKRIDFMRAFYGM